MGSSLSILASYRCICTRQGKENQCWNSYCRGWRSLLGQNWMKSLENKFLFFQSRLFQVKIEDEQTRFLTLVRHPEMHDVMKYVVTPSHQIRCRFTQKHTYVIINWRPAGPIWYAETSDSAHDWIPKRLKLVLVYKLVTLITFPLIPSQKLFSGSELRFYNLSIDFKYCLIQNLFCSYQSL